MTKAGKITFSSVQPKVRIDPSPPSLTDDSDGVVDDGRR